jgi:hypothetical protein
MVILWKSCTDWKRYKLTQMILEDVGGKRTVGMLGGRFVNIILRIFHE